MYVDILTESLKNKFDAEFRDGIHVSDLVLCPRRAVERRLNPRPVSMKELNFFTSGRAIHDSIQTLAVYDTMGKNMAEIRSGRFEIEKSIEVGGISGHVDLYDTEHNTPIECKSYRAKSIEAPKPHHVDQLKSYMAMLKSPKGTILYQLLMHFDEKPFVEFDITMDESEMLEQLQKLYTDKAFFEEAQKQKNPMLARGIFADKNLNWLCRDCPLKEKCSQEIKA